MLTLWYLRLLIRSSYIELDAINHLNELQVIFFVIYGVAYIICHSSKNMHRLQTPTLLGSCGIKDFVNSLN